MPKYAFDNRQRRRRSSLIAAAMAVMAAMNSFETGAFAERPTAVAGPPPAGTPPITGITVPELTALDDLMLDFLDEYNLWGGVLALSRDGCIIYQRGFGLNIFPSRPVSEITPMRLASVEKPLCAAVIRNLAAGQWFSLDDYVFNLGQPEGGLLDIQPYDGLGDERLKDITVQHLLQHRGGWDIEEMAWCDSNLCDPQFQALHIADELGIPAPPRRINTVRYMLSQELTYTPGMTYAYSNFGYMLLGLIIEEYTGLSVATNVRNRILTPDIWVPGSEIFIGRTFLAAQSPREPNYISTDYVTNVFDPDGDDVLRPYGGWDHESFQGHGNLVGSAAPLLKFLDRYQVVGDDIGTPMSIGDFSQGHTGAIDGTSTVAYQRTDGINVVALFYDREEDEEPHYGWEAATRVYELIDSGAITQWPTECIDGMWVNFTALNPGFGGFSDPFDSMDEVVQSVWDGTRLHFQPGTSGPWTGVLDKKMLLDAPYGSVVIGQ